MPNPSVQRITKQRIAVINALESLKDFVSAQELHRYLSDQDAKISLATTYRILTNLTEERLVDLVRREDGENTYRQCAVEGHHHHIVCEHCGHAVDIETPDLEELVSAQAVNHGFSNVRHTMEIFGSCDQCS